MKDHVFYNGGSIKCSRCQSEDSQLKEGVSENFEVHIMRDLQNPGAQDQNLLAWAKCRVCKRQTQNVPLPFLYY